ncbi:hypothetical protein SDC9_151436 [bioreactor metagenome]|uniref:Uncharacterized protein n=1 Tax=bioreactor metagenome TaxID=1076179 RepID=A0A645ES21_9ZZZZ
MLAAARGENTGRFAGQRAVLPRGDGAIPEVLHRGRHVAEANRAAQGKCGAFLQIGKLDVGRAGVRDRRLCRLAYRRDAGNGAQTSLHARNGLDAVGNAFGQGAN